MGRIANIRINIEGIYDMGTCYRSEEIMRAYERFWKLYTFKENTFKAFRSGDVLMLGSIYGSLFVHPMEITGILETSNSWVGEMFDFQIKDLAEICNALKEYIFNETGKTISYEILRHVMPMPKEMYQMEKVEVEDV